MLTLRWVAGFQPGEIKKYEVLSKHPEYAGELLSSVQLAAFKQRKVPFQIVKSRVYYENSK